MVFAGSVNSGGVRMGSQATKTLTNDDAQAILQHVPNVVAISPGVGASVQVVNGNRNWATRVQGRRRNTWTFAAGRWLKAAIFRSAMWTMPRTFALSARRLPRSFSATKIQWERPFASRIFRSEFWDCSKAKGQNSFGQDQDDTMILPYTTVQKKISGISWLQMISAGS